MIMNFKPISQLLSQNFDLDLGFYFMSRNEKLFVISVQNISENVKFSICPSGFSEWDFSHMFIISIKKRPQCQLSRDTKHV